jgi:hypothetical protein
MSSREQVLHLLTLLDERVPRSEEHRKFFVRSLTSLKEKALQLGDTHLVDAVSTAITKMEAKQ